MEDLPGIFDYDTVDSYRLILAFFCLLTFILLFYFYRFSNKKSNSKKHNVQSLLFLALSFLFYFFLGFFSVLSDKEFIYILLSGCVSICFLLAIPFFSRGMSRVDTLSRHKIWKILAIVIALIYILQFALNSPIKSRLDIDIVISSMTILFFGIFIVWDFVRKKMKFLAYLAGLLIAFVILLQIYSPVILGEGKFIHINTTILSPALFLSIISVSLTFNWINELNFQNVAKIYSLSSESNIINDFFEKRISKENMKSKWIHNIAKDKIEDVIEEVILISEKTNINLEFILNLASRNSRNNANRIMAYISEEDFDVNRVRISRGLIDLIKDF